MHVDTNGAGDAYVGGLVSALVQEKLWRSVVHLARTPLVASSSNRVVCPVSLWVEEYISRGCGHGACWSVLLPLGRGHGAC